jgi:hypothetical protein
VIYSKLPLPAYLFFVLGVAIFLIITSVLRFKKDRKPVIVTYLSFAIGCIFIGILGFCSGYFPLLGILIRIIEVLITSSFTVGIAFMCYVGWTNKKDPNAKKKVIVSLSLFLVGAILFLIAYLI